MKLQLDNDDLWLAMMAITEYSDAIRQREVHTPQRDEIIARLDRLAEKIVEIRFASPTERER